MNKIRKVFILLFGVMACLQVTAQDKIVNPDISYAGNPRNLVIGGINVSGVEGYEDYVLTGISGLSVGDRIDVPGDDVTNAVKRYWKHGLFQKWRLLPTLSWAKNFISTSIWPFALVSLTSTISA